MVAKTAEDIAVAEAAYATAQAVHQGALDSYYAAGTPGFARWASRVEETWDDLSVARFALLAAYGMPGSSVSAARAAYAAKR